MANAILRDRPELIFVYNAESGLFHLLADAVHKMVRPETYPCRLCAVTYGAMGMRNEWREFLQRFGYPFDFLHRDELARRYGIADVALPAVFARRDERIRLWIEADAISRVRSLAELIELLESRDSQLIAFSARAIPSTA